MWRFLRELERAGKIVPGETRMLETTTGNSGAAFAWLCRVLGYPAPSIIIPEDMPRARIAQIQSYGADVIVSPPGKYITGISEKFQDVIPSLVHEQGYYMPQHWNDEHHCVAAMQELGEEILSDAEAENVEFDYFLLALGNGGSARGVGPVMLREGVTLLGVEPAESAIVTDYLVQKPVGPWQTRRVHEPHGIIGTGPFRPNEIYRNMKWVLQQELLSDVLLPTSDDARQVQVELMDRSLQHVGMSSAAVIWAVREFINRNPTKMRRKTFGVIFYDPAWKYL